MNVCVCACVLEYVFLSTAIEYFKLDLLFWIKWMAPFFHLTEMYLRLYMSDAMIIRNKNGCELEKPGALSWHRKMYSGGKQNFKVVLMAMPFLIEAGQPTRNWCTAIRREQIGEVREYWR